MESSSHLTRSLDLRSGMPQPNEESVGRVPQPGRAAGSAASLGVCREVPSRRQGRRDTGGLGTSRPGRRRVLRRARVLTSGEEFLMVADAVGVAPQGVRDRAASDAGRRHANPQICTDVAETLKCQLSKGSLGENLETVSVAMPHAQGWVAETAPGSRGRASLTILTRDRRQKPD